MATTTPVRIGIIICDRYRSCAGGKCLRALREREGAFDQYRGRDVELVGYTTCGGCPGGNIEYAPEELKKSGTWTGSEWPDRLRLTLADEATRRRYD